MDYKAKATHAVFEPYKRPANARVIRRDIDIVTSDSDIADLSIAFRAVGHLTAFSCPVDPLRAGVGGVTPR